MTESEIFDNFKIILIEKFKGKQLIEFLQYLMLKNFSRIEIMIIDSAIKNIPLESLDKCLLLLHNKYINIIQELTEKLKSI